MKKIIFFILFLSFALSLFATTDNPRFRQDNNVANYQIFHYLNRVWVNTEDLILDSLDARILTVDTLYVADTLYVGGNTVIVGNVEATTMALTLNAVTLTDGAPTDTEIDTATGTTPGAVASGWTTYLEDNSDGIIYQVISDGVDSWYYFKAVLAINP